MMGYGLGFDGFGFDGFEIMFTITFVLIFGMIVFTIVNGLKEWNKNNHSPVLSVDAKIVSKRMDVHHSSNMNSETHMTGSTTWYYATFEVESGDRMEMSLTGSQYGMLAEGDFGKLTFQGTRFLDFKRF